MAKIITVARQCGSGGHTIGVTLAARLGVPFYDKAYFCRESGLCADLFDCFDEKPRGLLYALATGECAAGDRFTCDSLERDVYRAGLSAIRQLADKGDCVVIGRGGNWALRGREDCLHLFLFAPLPHRTARVAGQQHIPEEDARTLICRTDRRRAAYYRFYTGGEWGNAGGYDCCLNSAQLGIEGAVELICRMRELHG